MPVRTYVAMSLLAVTAALPLTTATAQQVDPIAPLPPASAVPAPAPPVVVPPVLPPAVWQVGNAVQLLTYIRGVGREGLSPGDYDPAGLERAIRGGDPMLLSAAATDRFNKLSSDLALGHVRGDARVGWHIADKDLDESRQRLLLDQALASSRVGEALGGLLPQHPQYGALRYALEVTPAAETAKLNRIRLNMDRWRWLPRELGEKYIIVNVPAYHATLVENGATRWKQRAIAGAIKTPTPQLSVMATGVILNPWWEVPQSISKEVAGKKGYVAVKGKDGKVQRWRQPPGPNNALGEMKFVMPNGEAIFLHDTNARKRFDSKDRALSHGCIRTENIHDLAAELGSDDGGEWTRAKIDETLASNKTVEAKFVKPLPVYIVYFSSAALTDGSIVDYQDVYKRDSKVIAALLDAGGKAPGAAPASKVAAK
ncbi:MAG: L,D-transpeptidase family protein [Pseudomonadota bacterium]|nr:L,D-transpeptidase family protein [Pseudomonadota bacterium]